MKQVQVKATVALTGDELSRLTDLYEHMRMSDFSSVKQDAALYLVLRAFGFEGTEPLPEEAD